VIQADLHQTDALLKVQIHPYLEEILLEIRLQIVDVEMFYKFHKMDLGEVMVRFLHLQDEVMEVP
jgi:hypothetical protein